MERILRVEDHTQNYVLETKLISYPIFLFSFFFSVTIVREILALITLVTGPDSTQLCLVQFMPVTRSINAKLHCIHAINYNNHILDCK